MLTPEQIVVGKKYVNALMMGHVWLGVGRRRLFTHDEIIPESKTLVLIKSDNPQYIGRMIHHGEDALEGLWDHFQEQDGDTYYILTTNR